MPKFTCAKCGKSYKKGTLVIKNDGAFICWTCYKKENSIPFQGPYKLVL